MLLMNMGSNSAIIRALPTHTTRKHHARERRLLRLRQLRRRYAASARYAFVAADKRQPDMGQAHAAATRRQAAPVDFGDIADDFQHCIHNVGIDDCAVRTIYKKRNEPA